MFLDLIPVSRLIVLRNDYARTKLGSEIGLPTYAAAFPRHTIVRSPPLFAWR